MATKPGKQWKKAIKHREDIIRKMERQLRRHEIDQEYFETNRKAIQGQIDMLKSSVV